MKFVVLFLIFGVIMFSVFFAVADPLVHVVQIVK